MVGYLFYRLLGQVTNVAIPADVGDFALLDRKVVDAMLAFREHGMFWRGLRCYTGFRHTSVFFERPGRALGQTKYTLRKLMGLASNGLLSFSDLPLQLPIYLGLVTLAATLAIGAGSAVWSWAAGSALPVSLMELGLLFLGSVQLLSLGVVGEYLNRIYAEVRNRPRWIVATQIDQKEAGANQATLRRPSMKPTQAA
jgi:dolichol-phosphate mannosyltransferase